MLIVRVILCIGILFLVASQGVVSAQDLTPKEELGKLLYFDKSLSTPRGQSCASCHAPNAGFADPDRGLPVSRGVIHNRFGNRNSPTSAYAAYSPNFHYDADEGLYIGGQFWDGRAADLKAQAKGPFLNALEMNNPDKQAVINSVKASDYVNLFEDVYGAGTLDDVESAYDQIAEAIADFEGSSELNQFTSKYDYYLQGRVSLTKKELKGLALYNGQGKCSQCHPSEPGPYADKPLFTDFSYDNLGVPKNKQNPFYKLPTEFNPDGRNWVDYGLGGVLGLPDEMGKMKVPTLRNIAKTAPYAHNGYFKNLRDIVHFYNTRDVRKWPAPEVPENVNISELGNLGLIPKEEEAIVAFLKTLTDGYDVGRAMTELAMEDFEEMNEDLDLTGEELIPTNYALFQNSPNPFNPTTTIAFELKDKGFTTVRVYDILGREVTTLVSGTLEAGKHHITFDASGLSSGLYFYWLESNGFSAVKKMVVTK